MEHFTHEFSSRLCRVEMKLAKVQPAQAHRPIFTFFAEQRSLGGRGARRGIATSSGGSNARRLTWQDCLQAMRACGPVSAGKSSEHSVRDVPTVRSWLFHLGNELSSHVRLPAAVLRR